MNGSEPRRLTQKTSYVAAYLLCITLFRGISGLIEPQDFCASVPECSCKTQKSMSGLVIRCKNFTEDILARVPIMNTTILKLYNGTKKNTVKVMENLRHKAKNLRNLTMINCGIEKLELRWLPEHSLTLSLTGNGLKQVIAGKANSTTCLHEQRRLSQLKTIFFSSVNLTEMPSCLPTSATFLFFRNSFNFTDTTKRLSWPPALYKLKISGTSHIPDGAFDNITDELSILWITQAPQQDGYLPKLPDSTNLRSLIFQHSNISRLQNGAFMNMSNLRTINLANNKLAGVTVRLPNSLRILILNQNQIREIPKNLWRDSNIEILDLGNNALETVPLGLPKTLHTLTFLKNRIIYCDPEAFTELKALKTLDLSHNQLTRMPVGINSGIHIYRLSFNELSSVPGPEAYDFCTQCSLIDIDNNNWICTMKFLKMLLWITAHSKFDIRTGSVVDIGKCGRIPGKAFNSKWLKRFADFRDYISKPPFGKCKLDFQELNCTNLELRYFPKPPPEGLLKVVIDGNPDLKEVPDGIFSGLTTLQQLQLANNSLKRIPYGIPSSIHELNLRENNITEFSERDVEVFRTLVNLKHLFLEDNHLKTIYNSQLAPLTNLKWVGLEGNDLVCDCSLYSFILWYDKLVPRTPLQIAARYARCKYPEELHERDIRTTTHYYRYKLQCIPSECEYESHVDISSRVLNCSGNVKLAENHFNFYGSRTPLGKMPNIPVNELWLTLYLDSRELTNDVINLTSSKNLIHLDLSNNILTQCPIESIPSSIEELILAKNHITSLPDTDNIRKFLPKLKLLDLKNNQIKTVSPDHVTLLPIIESVPLQGNPFVCDCLLMDFIFWVKSSEEGNITMTNNLHKITCEEPSELEGKPLMEITQEEFCGNHLLVIIAGLLCMVVLVICLTIAMSVLLKKKHEKRTKKEILKGFQELLQQEFAATDQETGVKQINYKYEAFVSGVNDGADGEFLDAMIEELEHKRGYKLCITDRDFAPGISVADNIVECIGSSKLIILTLSRNFASSPWCQYEVQVALAELQRRRSKQIVLIMIENVTTKDALPGSVKSFLTLVPTIQAPHKHASRVEWANFWSTVTDAILKN